MVETLEKPIHTPSDPDRGARKARGRGSAANAAGTAPTHVLNRENLGLIGRAMNGAHWKADVAALLGCSKSQLTRVLNGQREPNAMLAQHMQYVLAERIVEIAELMRVDGLPYAGTPDVEAFISNIKALVERVPGQEPPRGR